MSIAKSPNKGFLARAHIFLILFGAVYVAILALTTVPAVQRQLLYCHWLVKPLFAEFDKPEKYGLAPFKASNVKIKTRDNETLGAWFVFNDVFYREQRLADPARHTANGSTGVDMDMVRAAVTAHKTVLYLHGNAGTRAAAARVEHASAFTARLDANVLALDYRGFGDSSGAPDEAGLAEDARAAFAWLVRAGARAEDVLLVGTSLGTGVAVQAAGVLRAEGVRPRGVVLLAPFSSVATLLDTYYILGLVPLLKPLTLFPPAVVNGFKEMLEHRFDSLAKVPTLDVPVMLVHAEDDWDIPHTHSATLFDAFVAASLPYEAVVDDLEQEPGAGLRAVEDARRRMRAGVVERTELPRLGRMEVFARQNGGGDVVHILTHHGGHERVGLQEGVQDWMGRVFGL